MPVSYDLGKSRSTTIPGIAGGDAVPYTSVSSATLMFAANENSKNISIKTTEDTTRRTQRPSPSPSPVPAAHNHPGRNRHPYPSQ